MDLHYHEFSELVVIIKGSGVHFSDKDEYHVCAGDVFFVAPMRPHGYKDLHGLELINVLYLPDALNLPMDRVRTTPGYKALFELEPESRSRNAFQGKLTLPFENLNELEDLISELEKELESKRSGFQFLAISQLMRIIGMLSRLYEEKPTQNSLHLVKLGETISFLENSYRQDISLDELAKMSRMSKSSLIRTFRRITGKTPFEYLLRVRLMKASALLTGSDDTIGEISMKCGFSDGSYFTRQFRKATRMPPTEYRKIARNALMPSTLIS